MWRSRRHVEEEMGGNGQIASRTTWLTLALCCGISVFEGYDLQAAGVVAPKVAGVFGLVPAQLGWFFSAATFGLMLGAMIGGRLSDRLGRKRVLIASVFAFGLMSVATAMSWDANSLLVTRFLTGVGLGGALPNLLALVSENAPPRMRSFVVGALYAGLPCGGALASLTNLLGAEPESWKNVFLVGGLAPILLCLPLALYLPESRAQQAVAAQPRPGVALALFGQGRGVATVVLWVAFFLALLAMYLLLNWLPSLLVGRGLSMQDASWVQMLFNIGGAVASVVAGKLMDGHSRRLFIAVAFLGTVAAVMAMAGAPATPLLSMVCGLVIGATVSSTQAILYGMAPAAYPTAVRGTGVGTAVSVGRLGSAAGPLLAAALLGGGGSSNQVLMALVPVVLVAGVLTWWLGGRPPAQD
jgi:AAHS family 3-hydroxyphenylpropionic acid transporter